MENTFEREMLAGNPAAQGEQRQEEQDTDLEQTSFEEESDEDFEEGAEDEDQALDTTEEM